MLSITKVNNSIKVEGLDNKQFPDNGTLMIPLNSVILTLDESNIATFRSAANNDVLFSGVITDIQISGTSMTKQTITTAFTAIANSSGGGGGTVDAYTKAETDALLATKANESELSDYSTTQEMNTAIATATNDMATMTWVGEQGYLTQHQDISGLATKSELAEVEAEIPSLEGYATEQWVENQNYLTEHQSLDNYYTKAQTDTAISTATNDMATETWVQQQGYLTQHQDISGLATKTELSDHTGNTVIHVTALDKTNWNAKAELSDIPDVTGYINGAVYDSQTKRINFKHGDTVVAYIDATPFVVDGMVDTVEITGGNLVITWNTDAGKQSTSIPLTDIFNPDNYYDKTETDALLAAKANSSDLAVVASSGSYTDLTDKPNLFSGDYNDLTNKPTIPAAQINSDWNESDTTSKAYIQNKPTIPTVPTNVSAFTNDAGYTTNTGTITGITMNGVSKGTSGVVDLGTVITDISGKQDVIDSSHKLDADLVDDTTSTNKFVTASDKTTWGAKQDALVSGTNIKTINNESILGSGNITIQGGGSSYSAGTNISIDSSGGTDTINCTLPIKAGTNGGIIVGDNECTSTGNYNIALGHNANNAGKYSICCASNSEIKSSALLSIISGDNIHLSSSKSMYVGTGAGMADGTYTKDYIYGFGGYLKLKNQWEAAFGEHNKTNHSSETFGDSGNVLFTIGNGYDHQSTHNLHNAFEVRQNGDVYIPDTDDTTDTSSTGYSTKPMLRLQDYIATIRSLVTRVTALETALGTISSSLDSINGEVI